MRKKSTVEHRAGERTGYETDGVNYWLAPKYVEQFGAIRDQEQALDAVVEMVVKTVIVARRNVEAQKRNFWKSVYQDLNLDEQVAYTLDILGKLSPVEREVSEAEIGGDQTQPQAAGKAASRATKE